MATRSRMASRALSRAYDDALRPVNLRITQFSVLVGAALSEGRMTITELADRLGLERSGLSRNLDGLERRGLVVLGPETQHRARSVAISAEGNRLLEKAVPLWTAAQRRLRDRLGQQWDATMRMLTILET